MDDQNRSHGKIDNLPADLKHEVENRLLNGETYEEISNYLKDQRFIFPLLADMGENF